MEQVAPQSVFEGFRPPMVRQAMRMVAAACIGPPLALVLGMQAGRALGLLAGVVCGLACEVAFVVWALSGGHNVPTRTLVGDRSVTFEIGGRTSELPLTELVELSLLARAVGVTSVSGEVFVAHTDRGPALIDELHRQIAIHPEARAISERLKARATEVEQLKSNGERVTSTIAGLAFLMFVLEVVTGALRDLPALVRLGAGSGRLVAAGQINRLVTANFLHGSYLHLLMNLSSLVSLGTALERWSRWYRLVPLVFLSGVTGVLAATALRPDQVVVGLSAVIYGLLGAIAVTSYTFRRDRLAGVTLSGRQWLQLGLINGLINLLPAVSFTAHLSGFVTGALVAVPFLRTPTRGPFVSDGVAKVLAGVMIALVVLAMTATVAQALTTVRGA